MFDYTSYFVTVGLSNTVQMRLLGNYSVMLELLESLLCCLARYLFLLLSSFFFFLLSSSFSSFFSLLLLEFCFISGCNKDVISTSACQALRNQACTKTLAIFRSCDWFCHG